MVKLPKLPKRGMMTMMVENDENFETKLCKVFKVSPRSVDFLLKAVLTPSTKMTSDYLPNLDVKRICNGIQPLHETTC